jgi:hypothetical protein
VTYWKLHQRIIGNPTATDYLLGSTESRHDMGRAACHTQGLPSFGSVVLDLDGDHYFLSSKKRSALRFCAGGVERHRQRFRARTSSRDRCGARGREASEPERVAGKIATSGRTRTTPLRSRDDLQPATLLDGLDVFAAAWTQSSCGLVEKWHGSESWATGMNRAERFVHGMASFYRPTAWTPIGTVAFKGRSAWHGLQEIL